MALAPKKSVALQARRRPSTGIAPISGGGLRDAFGGHGAASDGGDIAADDEEDGATDYARGANHGGRDVAGQDPIDIGRGGGG